MKIIKKIDDLGRIAIPKDIRRALRLMGGDEIEIVVNDEDIILRKHNNDTISKLHQMRDEWEDETIRDAFNDLIVTIENKIEY